MSELNELFNYIKIILKNDGVDIEDTSENIATTTEVLSEKSKK